MAVRGKLRTAKDGYVLFMCPGCDGPHALRIDDGTHKHPCWGFNGNYEKPTFMPSVLSNGGKSNPNVPVCHSFVTDGKIQYLNDCTHELAGQTVDLPDWDKEDDDGEPH